MNVCIGNGQVGQLKLSKKVGTLNCMHDQQMIIRGGEMEKTIVRRLTPLECERLQGFPSEKKWNVAEMTKDEYIAWNINEGNIIVDTSCGKVFTTRGSGGMKAKA